MPSAPDDETVMSLVEQALQQPAEKREGFVRKACSESDELFEQVWDYVRAEERMKGFLRQPMVGNLSPLFAEAPGEATLPFQPGELLLGRFEIIRLVAEGGMGIVYEALDKRLLRHVAVKCAKAGFGSRLPPEARHASEVNHPNVCKVFDIHTAVTQHGDVDFLTMEFLEGETLADRLRAGPIEEKTARSIAEQLCAGLAEAHRHGVIHGDLKTNNVILTADMDGGVRAVITDFGLARQPSAVVEPGAPAQLMQSGPVGGAAAFMAPELAKGAKPSKASDVYALGVILVDLLRIKEGTKRSHAREKLILGRCLAVNPEERYQDAQELAQALSPERRMRWLLVSAAAAVLAALSGWITFERATAPKQTVKLAMLPFAGGPVATALVRDTEAVLDRLQSNAQTKFVFIPEREVQNGKAESIEGAHNLLGATHVLQGSIEQKGQQDVLHVSLTDARIGVKVEDWVMPYQQTELRYAPVALAGMVTNALRLPPLVKKATVNEAARKDYEAGLEDARNNVQPEEAVHLMERAVAADPDSPLTYAGLAEAEWSEFRHTNDSTWKEKAKLSARNAELRNPDLPEVHLIRGLVSDAYEQAEQEYKRVIELEPNNGDAYRRLGNVLDHSGQDSEALAALRMATQVRPDDYRNHWQLASFYNNRSQYVEALAEFQKLVTLKPKRADTHRLLGAAFYQLGRWPEAEEELRLSLRIQATSEAEHILANVLACEQKYDEAVGHYTRAISLGPQTSLLWLDLGRCYSNQGRESEARAAFGQGQALAERSLGKDFRQGRERVNLAYFEARLGDENRAASDIAQAMQGHPDDDTISVAVLAYEALNQRDQTLDLLAKSPAILKQMGFFPELAGLRRDSRYIELLTNNHIQ